MTADLKLLQFKQRDTINQTYMQGGTQRKKWVEVLKDKIQGVYSAGIERDFLHLWKTGCKYQKVVQLGPSTNLCLYSSLHSRYTKMEGGAGILKNV